MLSKRDPQLDVNDLESFESLKNHSINVIIVCTKDTNNHVLTYAVKHKIDYIDITKPSNELLKARDSIKHNLIESKIVFSSGWMGGIAPSLLYSTGILVSKPFFFYQNNLAKKTKHFLDEEDTIFHFHNQKRKVSDFDIPDLYIFNQIEQIPNVRAKMTFGSNVVTAILHFMQKIGFFKLLSFREKKWIFGGSGNGDISSFEIIYSDDTSKETRIVLKCARCNQNLLLFQQCFTLKKCLKIQIQRVFIVVTSCMNPRNLLIH